MLRTAAISIAALFLSAGAAWAQYTYDDVLAGVRRDLDRNTDGVVSQSEYATYFRSWVTPPAMSDFDANGNSMLEGSEITAVLDHVIYDFIECDENMDYRFSGTELTCLGDYVP